MAPAASQPTLWHLSTSHFSEKVRWALDHKSLPHRRREPPPGAHIAVALLMTRGHAATLPVLALDGVNIADSTAIIATLERRFPDPPLYPADERERLQALALEDWLDEHVGPATRLLAFHELGRDSEAFAEVAAQAVPRLAPFRRALVPYSRALTAARYGARSERAADQARDTIRSALDRIESELGEGDYLVGERFSVADLTAAALLYPLVNPAEGPLPDARMPAPFERFRDELKDRRSYRWVQETFRRHRNRAAPASR